jgi:hypothetical protein
MKAMMAGFAAIVLIAVVASVVLKQTGFSAHEKFSGSAVRLDP